MLRKFTSIGFYGRNDSWQELRASKSYRNQTKPQGAKVSDRKIVDEATKMFADNGKLIEAGWHGFKISVLQNAPEVQITEMRKAFFAGAQHLFSSILNMLEPGQNETETDLSRMDLIDKELRDFIKEFNEQSFT